MVKALARCGTTTATYLSRIDEEGRATVYTYNEFNQRLTMTEAVGNTESRTTTYEYVSDDIDLVTKTISPSIHAGSSKEVINTYDDNLNITAVTVNGFDAGGDSVSRITSMSYDNYGKVTEIDGPRTDINDVTTLDYYDCATGAECGQLEQISNAAGHVTTFDLYDAASRLLQSTNAIGVVTTYTYHPRGWLLSMTQTPPSSSSESARVTSYSYDNEGQLTRITYPDNTFQHFVYDQAHDLREISDHDGNKLEYQYDAKGNRTHELIKDPDGTLVRSTITTYDIRNFIESINSDGSVTQLINDAVGNLSSRSDPNANPTTEHEFDSLDRLTRTLDALANDTEYQYNVADQLIEVQAPNGATTDYEYDDLGNLTKETSPDRGTIYYTHDEAGNVVSMTDARGIVSNYQYDALNRLTLVSYPNASENVGFSYDSGCDNPLGRLCEVQDG